ncbi:AMP-binding protein [Acinetobacter baumannii]
MLLNRLRELVEIRPNNIAIQIDNKKQTYSEFWKSINSLELFLAKLLRPGDNVCTLINNEEFLTFSTIFALYKLGNTYVPLNEKFPYERNVYIINNSNTNHLIVDGRFINHLELILSKIESKITIIFIGNYDYDIDYLKNKYPNASFYILGASIDTINSISTMNTKPNNCAYILYTSGTTGNPKGVPISKDNLETYILNVLNIININHEDICSQFFELTFDLSIHDIFVTFYSGATLCCFTSKYKFRVNKYIQDFKISVFFTTPSTLALMKGLKQFNADYFRSLKYSLLCGEPLTQSICKEWHEVIPSAKIINLYGPTETTIAISFYEYYKELNNLIVPIGKVFSDHNFMILDNNLQESVCGELYLSGPQISDGYIDTNAKITSFVEFSLPKNTRKIWYKTGDLVKYENNILHYLGRIDRQVKINGYRVELQEIEARIKMILGTELVSVILKNTGENKILIAYITNVSISDEILMNQLKTTLPNYMLPNKIVRLSEFKFNNNGKVDYNYLNSL